MMNLPKIYRIAKALLPLPLPPPLSPSAIATAATTTAATEDTTTATMIRTVGDADLVFDESAEEDHGDDGEVGDAYCT
jgi:hypothetical protein